MHLFGNTPVQAPFRVQMLQNPPLCGSTKKTAAMAVLRKCTDLRVTEENRCQGCTERNVQHQVGSFMITEEKRPMSWLYREKCTAQGLDLSGLKKRTAANGCTKRNVCTAPDGIYHGYRRIQAGVMAALREMYSSRLDLSG